MFNVHAFVLVCFAIFFISLPARAELPSLMPDEATGRASAEQLEPLEPLTGILGDFLSLRQGRLDLPDLGPVEYSFANEGLKASVGYRRASVSTFIGYDGVHRLAFGWRSQGRNFRVALVIGDRDGEHRLELARDL